MSVYNHSGQRRQHIVHMSLVLAFLLTLIIHVWPRPFHVAAITATLIIQIAGMPARIPSISPDQATSHEVVHSFRTKHGKQAAFTSGLDGLIIAASVVAGSLRWTRRPSQPHANFTK